MAYVRRVQKASFAKVRIQPRTQRFARPRHSGRQACYKPGRTVVRRVAKQSAFRLMRCAAQFLMRCACVQSFFIKAASKSRGPPEGRLGETRTAPRSRRAWASRKQYGAGHAAELLPFPLTGAAIAYVDYALTCLRSSYGHSCTAVALS